MPIDLDPHLARAAQALPGVAGSFLAMWRGRTLTLGGRVLAFCTGCAVSYWCTPLVVGVFPATAPYSSVVALLLGWFGKTVVDKVFEAIEQLAPGALLMEWLRKVFGLPAGKAPDQTKG